MVGMKKLLPIASLALYLAYKRHQNRLKIADGHARLAAYGAKTANLSYGSLTYLDNGLPGEVLLVSHGIFGGFDQLLAGLQRLLPMQRIIVPSRFGYLGSDVSGAGTPKEQAKAFAELLDRLGIEKVFLEGFSAGATPALRFAFDYPERVKGLILIAAAPPSRARAKVFSPIQGPPGIVCNDQFLLTISPLVLPLLGMDAKTIDTILPISERRLGVSIDAWISNPDMTRNFDDYPIEKLSVPTLLIHAKNDRVVPYFRVKKVVDRFPDLELVLFETGGHLLVGQNAVDPIVAFIDKHR